MDNKLIPRESIATLARYYTEHPGPTGVLIGAEVGVYDGEHADTILANIAGLSRLYLVDIWAPNDGYPDWDKQQHWDDVYQRVRQKYANDYRVMIFKGDSPKIASALEDSCLSFVYIDANHYYESVLADLKAWWGKIEPNGWMLGHDWTTDGVAKAVIEFTSSIGVQPTLSSNGIEWWFQNKVGI